MRLHINLNEGTNYSKLGDVLENIRPILVESIAIDWVKVNEVKIKKATIDLVLDVEGFEDDVVLTSEANPNELLEVEINVDKNGKPIIEKTNEKESNLSDIDKKIIEGLDTDFKPIESKIGYEGNILRLKANIGEYEIDLYEIPNEFKLVKRFYKDTSLIQEVLYEPKDWDEYKEIVENFKKSYLGK